MNARGLLASISRFFSRDPVPQVTRRSSAPRRLRASFDAAETTRLNERHWANADGLSADAAANPQKRKNLRERARYEAQESNPYAKGASLTLANDTIGTGPRLQLMIPGRPDVSRAIEREFMLWSYEVRLADKLRTMRMAKAVDGEAFAKFVTNWNLPTRVLLDLQLIEADRVTSQSIYPDDDPLNVDGIRYDSVGNPISYTVLREHPGATSFYREFGEYDIVDARDMVHLFRRDRPEQHRGVSEFAPSLQVFAELRRFSKATILAAEYAASLTGVLYTDDRDDLDGTDSVDAVPGESVETDINTLTVLDAGRKLAQLKAEHPATTYEMFHREKLKEAGRCLLMPYPILAGDSSRSNYASGRLDHQTYDRSISIEQDYIGSACLDRLLLRWLEELRLDDLTDGKARNKNRRRPTDERLVKTWDGLPPTSEWNWLWFFDGRPHVDPLKEAAASTTLINGLLQTEKAYFAERGLDWEEQERQMATELGVTVADFRKLKAVKRFVTGSAQEEMVRQLLELEAAQEQQADSEEFANAD